MRVVFWGTYDIGKPRVRILLRGLRSNGVDVIECHKDVWGGIEDKSQIKGFTRKLRLLFIWLLAYPGLIWRYLRLPKHDAVVVGYLGQLDVLVLWPFAKIRGVPIVWDAFLSLYNTVVEDRRMVGPHNPIALLLWLWEWLACRMANLVILDTGAHGRYFSDTFNVGPEKIRSVFVGAEPEIFDTCRTASTDFLSGNNGSKKSDIDNLESSNSILPGPKTKVLFYGQFIPLHGIDTVIQAAKLTEKNNIHWTIVGTGQESQRIHKVVEQLRPCNLEWIEWVPYRQLVDAIKGADVCLGIFGATEKASRVIPNKAFQILMSGSPLITRDSAAIRELVPTESDGIWLIPPADPDALARAVLSASARKWPAYLHNELKDKIHPDAIAKCFISHIDPFLKSNL